MDQKQIKIDMEYLLFAYEDTSVENLYYFDTEYGDIRLVNKELSDLKDLTDEIEIAHERFLYVPKPPKELLSSDLKKFADSVQDAKLRNILTVAMESPHVLSAFKAILAKHEDELLRLQAFLKTASTERLLQWLRANGLEPEIS
jgi:hypothetical protein